MKTRERTIAALRNLSYRYPELRIGQIIGNAVGLYAPTLRGGAEGDPYYVEDDELADYLEKYIELSKKES